MVNANCSPGTQAYQHEPKLFSVTERPVASAPGSDPLDDLEFLRKASVMRSIDGFILSGGQSRRMGRDKCELTLNGQTFVERIFDRMAPIASSIKLVGNFVGESRLPQVADIYSAWGALGGVHAALANCSSKWALVVACDFPFVTTDLFARMNDLSLDFEAVAPVQADGVPQPLCTLYRVDPCLAQAEQLIKSGERKPVALLQSVRTRWIDFDELADLEGSESFFYNINTPEDYARITTGESDSHSW